MLFSAPFSGCQSLQDFNVQANGVEKLYPEGNSRTIPAGTPPARAQDNRNVQRGVRDPPRVARRCNSQLETHLYPLLAKAPMCKACDLGVLRFHQHPIFESVLWVTPRVQVDVRESRCAILDQIATVRCGCG